MAPWFLRDAARLAQLWRNWLKPPLTSEEACARVGERYHAEGVLVIVVNGDIPGRGQGNTIAAAGPQELLDSLPKILEDLAANLRGGSAENDCRINA